MRKVMLIVLLCAIISSSLTSCYGAREVDEWVFVYMIGIDKGVSNTLRFTFQIATMKAGTGIQQTAGSQQTASYTSISIDAPSLNAASNMMESSFSRKMNYTHAKYIVISEDIAKQGVDPFIDGMIRSAQVRRIMNIVVTKGPASQFIDGYDIFLTDVTGKASEAFITQQELNGFFVEATYNDFLVDLKSTHRQPVVTLAALNDFSNLIKSGDLAQEFKSEGDYYAGELPRSGGSSVELLGAALFDGDKMVGQLNGDESRALLILRNEFKSASITMVDPKEDKFPITLLTKQEKKTKITVDVSGAAPVINAKVFLECDMQNIQSAINYESLELNSVLENAFEEYIKGLLDKTINKCQELNVDSFGFGHEAVKHFLTIQDWEAYNWVEIFKTARITTEVEVTIRRTGTLLITEPSLSSGGD